MIHVIHRGSGFLSEDGQHHRSIWTPEQNQRGELWPTLNK